jgi:carboxypeptidase family protein
MMTIRKFFPLLTAAILALAVAANVMAQGRQNLRGVISDEFGATIVGATVTLAGGGGAPKTATTNADGTYSFTGIAPGKYTVVAAATGFAPSDPVEVDLTAARRDPLNFMLKIAAIETQVKVDANTPLSTDTNNNANQQVISGKDLDALPDDPDELAAALQALAGPSIGPNGGQIFVDGFSGSLPPKEAIREIRINQNPFSPENDQPSSRIDILTRPGTDKFRGSVSVNFNDESLNSRNPFTTTSTRPPFQVRQFSGSVSGPIIKGKASFFVDMHRNELDDNELVRATVLGPNFNIVQFGQGFLTPRRNWGIGPRFDYAINSRNTLVARYSFFSSRSENNGVIGFNLPARAYDSQSTNHNLQLTETAVLNAFTINETRFQFSRNRSELLGDNTVPTLGVSGAFGGCAVQGTLCSSVGHRISNNQSWELNNFTQIQKGNHAFKFGGRIRGVSIDEVSPSNFGGAWGISGGFGPAFDAGNNPIAGTNIPISSIERYRRTALIQANGLTAQQLAYCSAGSAADCLRKLGGGTSSFSINTGNPNADVSQTDVGFYGQDDWRIRPNLMLSYGLRYENQTNINSKFNFAPRFGFAWSPGAANSTKPPKMVIRGGGGLFYNRFSEGSTLQANRLNGSNQLQYGLTEPFLTTSAPSQTDLDQPFARPIYNLLNIFPNVPTPAQLAIIPPTQQIIYRVAPNLQAPMVTLGGIQVERQLPRNITAYAGLYTIRISHVIRQRDINAPLPGTITALTPNGIRPDPTLGDIYQYESSGKFRQTNFSLGFNSRLNPMISLSGNYTLAKTTNDTDGGGGFPVNSYDFTGEYGRGSGDVRHRFSLFGTITSPWWKLIFSPFVIANTGGPFNITTGRDTNLDRIANERPTFAALNAYCTVNPTRCNGFELNGNTSNDIIPRNFGNSPGQVSVTLRISRTFGFGGEANRRAANTQTGGGSGDTAKTDKAANPAKDAVKGGGGRGGPTIATGGGGGGGRGPGGPGGGGPGMMMMGGGGPSGGGPSKYSLTASLSFQNLFNHVNLGRPEGNLSSPNFGLSLSSQGAFGPGGGGGSSGAGNRRVYLNLRFSF